MLSLPRIIKRFSLWGKADTFCHLISLRRHFTALFNGLLKKQRERTTEGSILSYERLDLMCISNSGNRAKWSWVLELPLLKPWNVFFLWLQSLKSIVYLGNRRGSSYWCNLLLHVSLLAVVFTVSLRFISSPTTSYIHFFFFFKAELSL